MIVLFICSRVSSSFLFFFSSRRRHTRCALVTGVQTCALPIFIVNNPPVNALSWHVREGLKTHFEAALADDGVKAIVLRCDGATFIAGADISEFGKPPREIGRAHV